jgi:hypothetical protein
MNVDASTIAQPSQYTIQMASLAGCHVTSHTAPGSARHCHISSASAKLANST